MKSVDKHAWGGREGRARRGTTLEEQEPPGKREDARDRKGSGRMGRAGSAYVSEQHSGRPCRDGRLLQTQCAVLSEYSARLCAADQAGVTRPEALLRAFSKRFCTSAQFTMFQIALT